MRRSTTYFNRASRASIHMINATPNINTLHTESMIVESARALSAPVNGVLWVERVPKSCLGCASRDSSICACTWSRSQRSYRTEARLSAALEDSPIKCGQYLEIGLSSTLFLKTAWRFYFLPTCTLLSGALIAHGLWAQQILDVFGACLGLGFGLMLARSLSAADKSHDYRPLVLRLLNDFEPEDTDNSQHSQNILARDVDRTLS